MTLPDGRGAAATGRTSTAEMVVPESQTDTGLNEEGGYFVSRVDALVDWARKNSMWPLPLGLSCCAIEFMATAWSSPARVPTRWPRRPVGSTTRWPSRAG